LFTLHIALLFVLTNLISCYCESVMNIQLIYDELFDTTQLRLCLQDDLGVLSNGIFSENVF